MMANYERLESVTLDNGNTITYKIVNGTAYHLTTDDNIVRVLENARRSRDRIRLFLGDIDTGQSWLEEYDTMGYVSRSTGRIAVPILLNTIRSSGGGSILDHCIVRITIDKKVVYSHPNFHVGEFEIREGNTVYPAMVYVNGKNHANFDSVKKAERWIRFMKGETNKK
jgi:hypothetical protein